MVEVRELPRRELPTQTVEAKVELVAADAVAHSVDLGEPQANTQTQQQEVKILAAVAAEQIQKISMQQLAVQESYYFVG
jgi:hypothetical protein